MDKKPDDRARLDKKLLAYSTAAGAAIALSQSADASIIWSGNTNISINWGSSVSIDLDGGGIGDFSFSGSSSWAFGPPSTSYTVLRLVPSGSNGFVSTNSVSRLGLGQNIGPGNTFTNTSGYLLWKWSSFSVNYIPGTFTPTYGTMYIPGTTTTVPIATSLSGNFLGQRGYIGVQFDISGSTHYGWIDFEGNATGDSGTIHGWGYEDVAGGGIAAGDTTSIPEPGSLALLALGAAGLYASRKGRKESEASA